MATRRPLVVASGLVEGLLDTDKLHVPGLKVGTAGAPGATVEIDNGATGDTPLLVKNNSAIMVAALADANLVGLKVVGDVGTTTGPTPTFLGLDVRGNGYFESSVFGFLGVYCAVDSTEAQFSGLGTNDNGGLNAEMLLTGAGLNTQWEFKSVNSLDVNNIDELVITGPGFFGGTHQSGREALRVTPRGEVIFSVETEDPYLITMTGDVQITGLLSGFASKTVEYTDSHLLTDDDCGKVVLMNKATPITVTIPDTLKEGFACLVVQTGAGLVSFAASGAATLSNRQGHTGVAGQYSGAALNQLGVGGSNDYVLVGDTA